MRGLGHYGILGLLYMQDHNKFLQALHVNEFMAAHAIVTSRQAEQVCFQGSTSCLPDL